MSTIDEIEALLARATPGPLKHGPESHHIEVVPKDGCHGFSIRCDGMGDHSADAAFFVALRNAAPDLIAVVRAAAKVAKLDDANRPAKAWGALEEALAKLGVRP